MPREKHGTETFMVFGVSFPVDLTIAIQKTVHLMQMETAVKADQLVKVIRPIHLAAVEPTQTFHFSTLAAAVVKNHSFGFQLEKDTSSAVLMETLQIMDNAELIKTEPC